MNEGGPVGGGFEGIEDKGGIFGALGRSEIISEIINDPDPTSFLTGVARYHPIIGPSFFVSEGIYNAFGDTTEGLLPIDRGGDTPKDPVTAPEPKKDDGAGGAKEGGTSTSAPGLSAIDAAYKPLIDAMSAGREDRYKTMEKQISDLEARQKQARDEAKYYALLKTGLGLMGSKQPTLGGALGEAGLAGVQAYQDAQGRYEQGLREVMQARTGLAEAQRKEDIDLAKLQSRSCPQEICGIRKSCEGWNYDTI